MYKKRSFLVLALILSVSFLTRSVSAQPDTISKYRTLCGMLNDSSFLQYTFGGLKQKKSGVTYHIDFANNYGDTLSASYIKSNSFASDGTDDTLYISRQVDFDDKYTPSLNYADTLSDHVRDSLFAAVGYLVFNKEVSPNSSYFDNNSYVKFLIELRKTSDNSVLAVLDTAKCYKNGAGKLRYTTTNNTQNRYQTELPSSSNGQSCYIAINVLSSLVSGSISYKGEESPYHFWPSDDPAHCGRRQVGCTAYYMYKKSPADYHDPMAGSILEKVFAPYPNPAKNNITLKVLCASSGVLYTGIFDLLGKQISTGTENVNKGVSTLTIPFEGISNGTYFVEVFDDAGEKSSFRFEVKK